MGGAERVLVNLINESSPSLKHVVCSLYPPDSFSEEIRSSTCDIVCLNKRHGNDPIMPFKIARLCHEYCIDIVHSQGWATYLEGFIGTMLLPRRPKFVFAFRGKTVNELHGIPRRRILVQKIMSGMIDGIITPSHEMSRDYARTMGISPDLMTVIHNGVDMEIFRPPQDRGACRRYLGLNPGHLIVGCVARFDPVKNLQGLVRGFVAIHQAFPEARLLLVGDGEEMEGIRGLLRETGLADAVILPGKRYDVHQWLQAMDVYVQPSFYEGLSNTIMEAMSCALPIVAGRVGGNPELVQENHNGFLLDHVDPDSLAWGISALLADENLRNRFARASMDLVSDRFSLKTMVASYERFFANLVQRDEKRHWKH